jgi:Tfp pilus assembly protein PilF
MTLVRVNLAKALLRSGNPGEARAALEQALQFNPASLEAMALLSQILATVREENVGIK